MKGKAMKHTLAATLAIVGLATHVSAGLAMGMDCCVPLVCGCEAPPVDVCCATACEPAAPPKAREPKLPAAEPTPAEKPPAPAEPAATTPEPLSPPPFNTPAPAATPPETETPPAEAPTEEPAPRYSEPPVETPAPAAEPNYGEVFPDEPPAESAPPETEPAPATEDSAPPAENDSEPATTGIEDVFPPTGALAEPGGWASRATRDWTDAAGRRLIAARVGGATAEHVMLVSGDGATRQIRYGELSNSDLRFLRRQIEARRLQLAATSGGQMLATQEH